MGNQEGVKCFLCVFWDDVLCSYRKDVTSGVMARCSKCPEHRRFEAVMEKEDEEEARFVEEVRKHPDRYLRRELR